MYLTWTCKQTRQIAIVFFTCRSKSSVKKEDPIPHSVLPHRPPKRKKKMKKTRPTALLNGLPLQEGPRKESPDSNPQLLQSNKPFSLWQEAMIPHWKRSLFATLQAFHGQQLCTSKEKEKEPSEKKGDSFPSCTFFFFICLLLLYFFSFALNPLPFSQLAALKRKQTKPKTLGHFSNSFQSPRHCNLPNNQEKKGTSMQPTCQALRFFFHFTTLSWAQKRMAKGYFAQVNDCLAVSTAIHCFSRANNHSHSEGTFHLELQPHPWTITCCQSK